MRVLAALCLLTLTACATKPAEPRIVTQNVLTPVRVACVPPEVPNAPETWPDDKLPTEADKADERYRLVAAANERRRAWINLAAPVIAACR